MYLYVARPCNYDNAGVDPGFLVGGVDPVGTGP